MTSTCFETPCFAEWLEAIKWGIRVSQQRDRTRKYRGKSQRSRVELKENLVFGDEES